MNKICCSRAHVKSWDLPPIHYLHKSHNAPLLPPKICIGIVFEFSRDIFMSQEKLQTMVMQTFGGNRGVLWDCVSSECKVSSLSKTKVMREINGFVIDELLFATFNVT